MGRDLVAVRRIVPILVTSWWGGGCSVSTSNSHLHPVEAAAEATVWLGGFNHSLQASYYSTVTSDEKCNQLHISFLTPFFSIHSTPPLSSDSKQPSTSSHLHPPSLLSLSSHPPSLAAPAGTTSSLSAMTAGLHHLTGDNTAEEDEEEDYDA